MFAKEPAEKPIDFQSVMGEATVSIRQEVSSARKIAEELFFEIRHSIRKHKDKIWRYTFLLRY